MCDLARFDMPDLSLALKLSAIALLLFATSTLFIAGRFSARAIAAGIFTLSIAGYLGCQLCHTFAFPQWFDWLIHVGCFGVPVAFYLLTESLFEDRFRFRWIYFVLFLFIEAVNFFLIIFLRIYTPAGQARFGDAATLLGALPQTVSLGFILFAIGKTLLRRRSDLDEKRRNFRLQFISITAAYMLLVLISEIAFHGKKAPAWLDLLHSAGVLATVWFFASFIFTLRPGTLGEVAAGKAASPGARSEVNTELLAKLEQAMSVEKAYTHESLSIRRLAELLGTQEYLLRRLINAGLGYRNFNDYLNELRIAEAVRILADKSQAAMPIIRIAMDLGFGSLAPFNRAFKDRKGMTPTEFRKASL